MVGYFLFTLPLKYDGSMFLTYFATLSRSNYFTTLMYYNKLVNKRYMTL